MTRANQNRIMLFAISLLLVWSFTNTIEAQWVTSGSNIYYNAGYVGINTTSPSSRLTVMTYGWANSLELNNGSGYGYWLNAASDGLLFKPKFSTSDHIISFRNSSDIHILDIYGDGHINIGTSVTGGAYKLNVVGNIRANEIVVNTTGADFVFDDDYKLKNLDEVEGFIKENKHLPDIPAASEVQSNGVSLGEMQTKLLQKVEELTLYIIELKKENEKLSSRLSELEDKK